MQYLVLHSYIGLLCVEQLDAFVVFFFVLTGFFLSALICFLLLCLLDLTALAATIASPPPLFFWYSRVNERLATVLCPRGRMLFAGGWVAVELLGHGEYLLGAGCATPPIHIVVYVLCSQHTNRPVCPVGSLFTCLPTQLWLGANFALILNSILADGHHGCRRHRAEWRGVHLAHAGTQAVRPHRYLHCRQAWVSLLIALWQSATLHPTLALPGFRFFCFGARSPVCLSWSWTWRGNVRAALVLL